MDTESSPNKRRFLKKGQNQKYDPMKAIQEAKIKRKQEIAQMKIEQEKQISLYEALKNNEGRIDDITDSNVFDEESNNLTQNQSSEYFDLSYHKLSREESSRIARRENREKLSVRNIMNSSTPRKKSAAPAVSTKFQDLKYLKTIPKRVDWWLDTKPKKNMQTPSSKSSSKMDQVKQGQNFSKTVKGKKLDKFDNDSNTSRIRDKINLGIDLRKSLETMPDMRQVKDINQGPIIDHQLSYDSYELYPPNDPLQSTGPKQAIQTSLLSNNEEKLESLLERLDESKLNEKAFTAEERHILREDTQSLAIQYGSETLMSLFQLICKVEEDAKNEEAANHNNSTAHVPSDETTKKKTFDFEFEKLVIKLKEQYQALFEKKRLK